MASHEVTFEHDGEETAVEVPEDEFILDAAEAAGLDLPFSCRQGNCTSCTGLVKKGDVERGGVALSVHEEDEGYALLCSSYVRSDCRIVTGAQDEIFDGDVDDLF